MEEYPLETKVVRINDREVTLRELPVRFVDAAEKGQISGSLVEVCIAGSDVDEEFIGNMSRKQLAMMYEDIMALSYGDDWKELVKKGTESKKK